MRATWYILEDGTPVDPNEVTRDKSGALVHKNGKVAVGEHGNYRTSGVDVDEKGRPPFAGRGDHDRNGSTGGAAKPTKQAEPEEPPKHYRTRESKAR